MMIMVCSFKWGAGRKGSFYLVDYIMDCSRPWKSQAISVHLYGSVLQRILLI